MAAYLNDHRWLISEAAVPWLEAAETSTVSARLVARMRKELSAERTHLVLEQVELRRRAREKFTLAARMFFTRTGLEQATDELVAAAKAQRYELGHSVADLCCGIGGDLLALAARGQVVGVDADNVTTLFAETNCRVASPETTRAMVYVQDAATFNPSVTAAWHIDPDRRARGRRTTRIERYEPTLETLERMLGQNAHAAIKLAPGTIAPAHWRGQCELAWYGSRGECRQQVAWFGSVARSIGQRSATVVDAPGGLRTVVGDDSAVAIARRPGRYVYEPHAAVLAAHLCGVLCQQHALAAVTSGVAYLTGDRPIIDGALSGFEVLDTLPLDVKRVRAYLQERQIGRLEIKKRGLDVDPERLRQQLSAKGDDAATLIVLPIDGAARVLVTKRIISPAVA